MCRLILIDAVGRHQHAGHHRQRAERGRDHIAHNVAIVVLTCPDVTAVGAYHTRDSVIDQGIEVFDTCFLELLLILVLKYFRENILEGVVVFLGDSVLGCEPYILLLIERIVEARSREGSNGIVKVVHTLDDTVAVVKAVDQLTAFVAVLIGHTKLRLGTLFDDHFGVLVHVAVCVTGDADGLSPCRDVGGDAFDEDRLTEYRTVEDRTDSAVGALPHLLEVIFVHTRGVRGDGSAFDRYTVFLCCLS